VGLAGSLALLAASVALLYFGRGRDGDALPILQNWIVGTLFSMAILYLFFGGLMGVAVNLNWLH
jgi:hypothetical protein